MLNSIKSILKFLIVVILLSIGVRASAQQGIELGLQYMLQENALLNSSDMKAGPQLDYKNTLTYISWGAHGIYNFDKYKGIELGVLFSRQGQIYGGTTAEPFNSPAYNKEVYLTAVLNNTPTTDPYQARAELNVYKIPLLFRLNTDNTKTVYYTIAAGSQLDIISHVVLELNNEDVGLPGLNITPNDAYKKVTIDGVLALGIGINLCSHFSMTGQLRFDYGFQDVEKKDATYSYMNGATAYNYYGDGRGATHNATAALTIGVNYKF